MNSLHTKLKELRELREKANTEKWRLRKHGIIAPDVFSQDFVADIGRIYDEMDLQFILAAANHWFALIDSLKAATNLIEGLSESKSSKINRECLQALSYIYDLLNGKKK